MRFVIFIIILIMAGASDYSGASAQLKGDKSQDRKADSLDLSSLVKIVSSSPVQNLPDSAEHVVVFPKKEGKRMLRTDNILNLVIGTGKETHKEPDHVERETPRQKKSIGKAKKDLSSADVLAFMTKVYAEHGFYQSGHWDDAEDWSAITRNIPLPDYDPDDFYRPVWGQVTSTYGYRPKFGRLHKGIDLALRIGDTVRAALPGVVAKISYDPGGYGHYVVLVHNNGMETRYAHLQSSITSLGKTLEAGEPLGLGGNTGNSTGPHLHFEVRYRGTAIDPASLFNFHIIKRKEE